MLAPSHLFDTLVLAFSLTRFHGVRRCVAVCGDVWRCRIYGVGQFAVVCNIRHAASKVVLSEVPLRRLMWLLWLVSFNWSSAVGTPLIKAVAYCLMRVDTSKLAFGLCEGGVRLMIYFVVNDGLADGLFLVWPCLLIDVDDGRWHCCLLVLVIMMLRLVLVMMMIVSVLMMIISMLVFYSYLQVGFTKMVGV